MKVTKLLLLLRHDVHKAIFFPILTLSSSIKEPKRSPLNALQLFLGEGEILGNFLQPKDTLQLLLWLTSSTF